MKRWRTWLWLSLCLLAGTAHAATEVGVVTLSDAGTRVLRGATWYKLTPGLAIEDGDIVAADPQAQVQLEFAPGTLAALAGEGTLHVTVPKGGGLALAWSSGLLKIAAKPPGARVRTAVLEVEIPDGIAVMRTDAASAEVFVEVGSARLVEPAGSRDAKRGEYWRKSAGAPLASQPLAPKAFVAALPRNFLDPLPVLAPRLKSKPGLVVDHEITYAEAEPWLAGRDRAAFERRFASRLRDPAFRRAVEPHLSRYPSWDRMLHPEKYAPKPAPVK
jgi:hypothetical protein